MNRRTLLTSGTAATALTVLGSATAAHATPAGSVTPRPRPAGVYPEVADTSHASAKATTFFRDYFTAKTQRDLDAFANTFHPRQSAYFDATLGMGAVFTSRAGVKEMFAPLMAAWGPGAKCYPLRILGNTDSAIVAFVDTPEMFGAELRIISAIDFKDGKITRQVDYWDGRRNPVTNFRGPLDQYPHSLGSETVRPNASPTIDKIARRLNAALAAGDATNAATLFSADAVFEDITTRTTLQGKLAIGRYLQRALPELPYGPGTTVRHTLGSAQGGGYEWLTDAKPVPNGITALELDHQGKITRFTAVWDGSRLTDSAAKSLAARSIED